MPRIKTRDGVELYVKDWGEGRPVVLLHGWPLTADTFDDLSKAIADAGMRAISYDRRGFGRSSKPGIGYNYDTFASDLDKVLRKLDLKKAALVGFSMGSGEVTRYLGQYGTKRVRKAVLIGTLGPYLVKAAGNPEGVDANVFDDIKADPGLFYRRICEFLGIDASFVPPSLNQRLNPRVVLRSRRLRNLRGVVGDFLARTPTTRKLRAGLVRLGVVRLAVKLFTLNEKPGTVPPLDPETRRRLVEHFRQDNEDLGRLIGRDLSHWNA